MKNLKLASLISYYEIQREDLSKKYKKLLEEEGTDTTRSIIFGRIYEIKGIISSLKELSETL